MKQKILYVSDRPSMGADMLIKSLGTEFEILKVRSTDDVSHVPGIVLVSLAGLESSEKVKAFTDARVFVLGNQAEADASDIPGAEKLRRRFGTSWLGCRRQGQRHRRHCCLWMMTL